MAHGELITELLSSVSGAALQGDNGQSKGEPKKPVESKPSNRKPPKRDSKHLPRPRARSDVSDEDADADPPTDAFSVRQFCKRHGISPQLFYKFRNDMPDTFRVGGRVLISREAVIRWRQERERLEAANT